MGNESRRIFVVIDFVAFIALLLISALIGVYFGYKDRKKTSTANYYFGGMHVNPIAIGFSLCVTYISAITMIAIPAETYLVGTVNAWMVVPMLFKVFFEWFYIIPKYFCLKLTSIYEYLEMRFSKAVRRYVVVTGLVTTVIYLGCASYLPALALNAVTPLPLGWSIFLTIGICTFYTTLGGLKAVIWTDVLQAVVMLAGGAAVFIRTVMFIGGFGEMGNSLERGKRLTALSGDFDITSRKAPIAILFGWGMTLLGTAFTQPVMQRFQSCKTPQKARQSLCAYLLPAVVITLLAVGNGLAMYVYFEGCDPVKSGKLVSFDQGIPYMALALFEDLPGMAGVFVASIFSATLSTASSALNSVSVIVLKDIVLSVRPNISEKTQLKIGKIVVASMGGLALGLAFIISLLKANVIKITMTFSGLLTGPIIGIFIMGFFLPWTNSVGVISGSVFSYIFVFWMAIGSMFFRTVPSRVIMPPISTELCDVNESHINMSYVTESSEAITRLSSEATPIEYSFLQSLYSISFLYFRIFGFLTTVIIGTLASFIYGANSPSEMDPKLFIPIVDGKFVPKRVKSFFRFGVPELKDVHEEEDNQMNNLICKQ